MPLNKSFQRRLEVLDACLRRRQRIWTIKALLREVNEKLEGIGAEKVSQRSLYADLKYMIYDLDAPIEKYRQGKFICYRYANPDYSIRNLPVSQEEVAYLKDALDILKQLKGFQITQELETVVGKLENTLATSVQHRHTIIQFEHSEIASGGNWLDDIFLAVKEQTVLSVQYQPFFKEPLELVFHPYLLKEFRNRWFVIGRMHGQNQPTVLALDRILKAKPSRVEFVENDLFDPETYFESVVGVSLPDRAVPERIVLNVHRDLAPYILTKPIHSSQKLAQRAANGEVTIELFVINNYELRSVLLGLGPKLRVDGPSSLKEQMKKLYEEGISNYQSCDVC